ncbi:insulinase family protein [Sphingobacteriales bacterium UPWRP_1]|nr:hypothetical protein BVG80_05420 [Sphingobacteriales bacterium TSM_CSM]PSJ75896.1 insulinase family protein [Sphingobacteriales bacterium UPWRP_1]
MTIAPNRSMAPPLQPVTQLYLPRPEQLQFDNGIPVYLFNTEVQEVALVKLVFEAGKWQEPQRLVARFTNSLLEEGTANYTSRQLAEEIEFYGANLITRTSNNHAEVVLSCLNKHLPNLLPLLQEIITQATFPEEELQTEVRKARQRLMVNRQKTEYLADNRFRELIFGANHPYGYHAGEEDLNALSTGLLKSFYHSHYTPARCTVYLGGKFTQHHLQRINQYLGTTHWSNGLPPTADPLVAPPPVFTPHTEYISKPNAMQAAIRIGKPMFNKSHPQYKAMLFVNTLLGGFFGSRLMRNVREDKGFTYGIYSALVSMLNGGCFEVAAEVNQNVWQAAVKEIFYEISRLKTEPVSGQELNTVRNYLLGRLLQQVDGTFNLLSTVQSLLMYHLDVNYYQELVQTIQSISALDIQQLAEQHLNETDFLQVVAGA